MFHGVQSVAGRLLLAAEKPRLLWYVARLIHSRAWVDTCSLMVGLIGFEWFGVVREKSTCDSAGGRRPSAVAVRTASGCAGAATGHLGSGQLRSSERYAPELVLACVHGISTGGECCGCCLPPNAMMGYPPADPVRTDIAKFSGVVLITQLLQHSDPDIQEQTLWLLANTVCDNGTYGGSVPLLTHSVLTYARALSLLIVCVCRGESECVSRGARVFVLADPAALQERDCGQPGRPGHQKPVCPQRYSPRLFPSLSRWEILIHARACGGQQC